MTFTKKDLVYEVWKDLHERGEHLSRQQVEAVIDAVLHSLIQAMLRFERIEIRGFGVFRPVWRKPKKSPTPRPRYIFRQSRSIRTLLENRDPRRRR